MTKLFLVIAIMDNYQGTAVEIILTRKLFVFLLFMYLYYCEVTIHTAVLHTRPCETR